MRKKSLKKANPDLQEACKRLAEAAETFVNRAPRQKRLEAERSALFEALHDAQLVLSITALVKNRDKGTSNQEKSGQKTQLLEDNLKQVKTRLAKSQNALEQLGWLIQPVATTLEELKYKAQKAQTVLQTALKSPARVLPFRKSR